MLRVRLAKALRDYRAVSDFEEMSTSCHRTRMLGDAAADTSQGEGFFAITRGTGREVRERNSSMGDHVGQDERLLVGSTFGAAATAYADHRPDYAQAARGADLAEGARRNHLATRFRAPLNV